MTTPKQTYFTPSEKLELAVRINQWLDQERPPESHYGHHEVLFLALCARLGVHDSYLLKTFFSQ